MAATHTVTSRILPQLLLLALPLYLTGATGRVPQPCGPGTVHLPARGPAPGSVHVPATVHVQLGHTLEVPCKRADGSAAKFDDLLEWFILDASGSRVRILYHKSTFRPPEHVEGYTERVGLRPGTSTLLVEDASLRDQRAFICQITGGGKSDHATAVVRVFSLGNLEITANPNPIALSNETARVATCQTNNSYPSLQINWFKDGIPLESQTAMVESCQPDGLYTLASSLVYAVRRADHAAAYRCAVSYRAGDTDHSAQSRAVAIELHYPPDKVALSVESPTVAIKERDDVVLKCTSDANPPPGYSFSRLSPGGRVAVPGAVQASGRLVLRGVSADMSGMYACRAAATGLCAGLSAGSPPVALTVHYIDPLRLVPSGRLSVRVGDQVHISCHSSGSGDLSYRWIKDGVTVSKSTEMIVESAHFSDSGVYTCHAWVSAHPHVTTREDLSLLVQGKPKILSDESVYLQREASVVVSLMCEAVGFPKPSIKWSHAGRLRNTESVKEYKLTSELKLKITDDLQHVTCNASNPHGVALKVFHFQSPLGLADVFVIVLALVTALLAVGGASFVLWRKRRHRYRRHNGMNGNNLHAVMLELTEMDDEALQDDDECDLAYPAFIVSSL